MTASNDKARQLRDAVRHLVVANGTLQEARRPCGTPLSIAHTYALIELLQSVELVTVSDLARKLEIDRTNVSRLCARMEDAGEIARNVHPDDGRAWAVRLTPAGRKLARRVDLSSTRHFEHIAQTLGRSTAQVIEALNLLEHALASAQLQKEP